MAYKLKYEDVSKLKEHTRLKILNLRNILIDECKKAKIPNPIGCRPENSYDLVFNNVYLGGQELALDKESLKRLGITHVLNAAKGGKYSQVNTNQCFYEDLNIKFFGCNLMDIDNCKIEDHFIPATDFMHEALQSEGIILVHCLVGVSRSASLVLAYLVRYRRMGLEDAMKLVFKRRFIWPNDGFLYKLMMFEEENYFIKR